MCDSVRQIRILLMNSGGGQATTAIVVFEWSSAADPSTRKRNRLCDFGSKRAIIFTKSCGVIRDREDPENPAYGTSVVLGNEDS